MLFTQPPSCKDNQESMDLALGTFVGWLAQAQKKDNELSNSPRVSSQLPCLLVFIVVRASVWLPHKSAKAEISYVFASPKL